jgi:hypothetical protein
VRAFLERRAGSIGHPGLSFSHFFFLFIVTAHSSGEEDGLHLGGTRMSGDDLPTIVKFLEIHRRIANHRLLGAGECY